MSDDPKIKISESGLVRQFRALVGRLQDEAVGIAWGTFSIGLLVGLLAAGFEIVVWLKNGKWPHLQFHTVFMLFDFDMLAVAKNIEWLGVKKIFLWYLELPLSVGITGMGAILAGAFYVTLSNE